MTLCVLGADLSQWPIRDLLWMDERNVESLSYERTQSPRRMVLDLWENLDARVKEELRRRLAAGGIDASLRSEIAQRLDAPHVAQHPR